MSFQAKRKLVLVFLAVVCAWPLVHHGLVRGLGLNPWKWFGWSMYAVPNGRVRVFPYTLDDRPLGMQALQRLSPEAQRRVREAHGQFIRQWEGYRENAVPEAFGRALLEAHPEIEGVKLYVEYLGVTRETGMFERQQYSDPPFVYRR